MIVHVVGAGVAGLSAALALHRAKAGIRVILHEAAPHAGGRCRSWIDRRLGTEIDNGTHAVLGANTAVLRHVAQSSARVLLVVPDWPSQPWWPLLLRLSRRSRLLRLLPDLYERRAEVDGIWKYVAVQRPFFETRVVIVSSA